MTDEPQHQPPPEPAFDTPSAERAPDLGAEPPADRWNAAADADEAPAWRPPPRPRPRGAALAAGALAAAATAGALVAFGTWEGGGALAPFTGAGRLLLGIAPTEGPAATALAFVTGVTIHVVVCALWGALFALLAAHRRPWHLALTAALVATAVYSASTLWLPGVLRLGYALRATQPQLVLLHALLGGGLWAGTRLAQLGRADA